MKSDVVVTVVAESAASFGEKVAVIEKLALSSVPAVPAPPVIVDPPVEPGPVVPEPPTRTPWFEVGEATGSIGDRVEVPVFAGCAHHIDGFHIGGGLGGPTDKVTGETGYGTLRVVDVILGNYLESYFRAQEMIMDDGSSLFYENWQMVDWNSNKALPEEFWEYGIGFFSISNKENIPPIPIPSGTELFRLKIEILPAAAAPNSRPSPLVLSCRDEYYYTQQNQRRRNYEYTYPPQGFTHIDCFDGKLTIV